MYNVIIAQGTMKLEQKIVLMYDKRREKCCIILLKETIMNIFETIIHKILIFEKEPQKIGLSQLKEPAIAKKSEPSIKNKDVKLSDLMRRAG